MSTTVARGAPRDRGAVAMSSGQRRRAARSIILATLAAGFLLLGQLIGLPSGSAASPPGTVVFTAAGDFGSGSAASGVITGMGTDEPDLALALGDLSYGTVGSESAWCDFVTTRFGAGRPFELVAGNHDNGSNGNINDFSACLPNQLPGLIGTYGREYYVDYPQSSPLVRFIMISPNMAFNGGSPWNYSAGSARYNWTAAAIDQARSRSIPWVVVGMHYPCLSIGVYACPAGEDVLNLLVSKRVDLVLTGHEHMYQRTKQLALGGACARVAAGAFSAACVADADTSLAKGAGTVFITSGLGGQEQRTVNNSDAEAGYFAAASGSNANPSYGFLRVTATSSELDAAFVPTSGSFSDAISIGAGGPVPNQPPVPQAAVSCTGLACSYDGTNSSDPDGTVATHAWVFGDGESGSGPSVNHTYAAAGNYIVQLTVTDDDGASATTQQSVAVTDPTAPTVHAADTFTRTVTTGWGAADTGGTWSTGSGFSVSGGAGQLSMAPGAAPAATLNSVSARDADVVVSITPDRVPAGGTTGSTFAAFTRRTSAGRYWAELRFAPGGAVYLTITAVNGSGTKTNLASTVTVPGITLTAGTKVNLRLQTVGASPTTVRARVWTGATEPTAWQRTATDSTAALQGPGAVGFQAYTSSSVSNGPVRLSVDDYRVTAP